MTATVNNYKEMLKEIYMTNLKYYAFGKFPADKAEDLIQKTIEYFLNKYETYKENNYKQLEGNLILKIQNLHKDNIRKDNASSLIGEVIFVGGANDLQVGDKISIRELKKINRILENDNLTLVKYRSVSSNVSFNDEIDQGSIDTSVNLNINDREKQIKLNQAYDLVNKLDDKCKNLIKYQVINEKKYKEIAEHFNMKIGTVMSSLSRCWDKIKELKNE